MFQKRKVIISLILMICLTMNLSTVNYVWGAEISAGTEGLRIINNVVVGYVGTDANVVIPDGVTGIQLDSFRDCTILNSIIIPDSVTSIETRAFYGCSSLKSINIPVGVTTIPIFAFYGCSTLSTIKLPSGVTSIGGNAFNGCSALSSIEIPNGVSSIGNSAFNGCSSLSSIELPSGVTSIGNSAFNGCSSLSSIELPSGVTSIEASTFKGCSSLRSIELPSGVTSIGSYAFNGCSSLSSIELPSGVTSIGSYAFNGCSSLSSIELPSSVTSIDGSAFRDCSSLSGIELPSGVTSIGNSLFLGCSSLGSIELPSGVTSIGDSAFYDCSSLGSIELPNGVTSISGKAFYGCRSLGSIEIPDSAINIGQDVFTCCNRLIIYGNAGSQIETYAKDENIAFWVVGSSIDSEDIFSQISDTPNYYDGTEKKPEVKVWLRGKNQLLKKDTDYTVEYADNVNAGKASVTIRGKKYYSGSITKQFDIEKQTIGALSIALSATTFTYDGNAKEPVVTVRSGGSALKPETDYTVSYKKNVEEGTADVIITGTGTNYTGSVTEHFTITKTDKTVDPKEPIVTITKKAESIQLNPKALYLTKGKKSALQATIAPADTTNQTLTWTSSNNNVATVDASGNVTAIKNGTAVITATTTDGSLKSAQCNVTVGYAVTYKCNGGTNVDQNPGVVTGTSKVKLKNPTRSGYAFAGWYTDKKLTKGISSLAKGTKSGVTLYAKWDKVKVAKTNVRDLKSIKKKKLTVSYDKVDGAKGYELVYSTDKKLTKNTTTITTGKTSTTIAGLANGKKYYVKVRAYKIDSMGNKVYGKYSGVMSVKVMK